MINIKTIGIILRKFAENNKLFLGTRQDLFKILTKFKVNIIGIPITSSYSKIKQAINLCDGLILPGGDNYTKKDLLITRYLYDHDIPTLGICLGMQLMTKCLDNCQEKDLENHYCNNKYVHEVKINKNSLLFKILKKENIWVNSRHHSYIPHTKLKINAISQDIIEGIEAPNKKFYLGIQWHPESLNNQNSYRLFKYFIQVI